MSNVLCHFFPYKIYEFILFNIHFILGGQLYDNVFSSDWLFHARIFYHRTLYHHTTRVSITI